MVSARLLETVVYGLFACLLIALIVLGLVRAHRGSREFRPWVLAGLLAWLAALLFMTIRPGAAQDRLNLLPLVFYEPGAVRDAVLNVFVFLPLGILLATLGWRLIASLGVGFAVSLTIEITQYLTNLGRTADVNDVITNAAGAVLGWLLATVVARAALRRRAKLGASPEKPA